VRPPPDLQANKAGCDGAAKPDDWTQTPIPPCPKSDPPISKAGEGQAEKTADDRANAGLRREPELPDQEEVAQTRRPDQPEFQFDEGDDPEAIRAAALRRQMSVVLRQTTLDPADDLGM
jgi:type IV secretion system protein VirD4